jgi:COMPASS component SWD3
MYDL